VTHDPAIGRRARHRVRLVDGRVVSEEGAAVPAAAAATAR